ncbi:ion transporter [Pseudochryseolinea flava]|uniref:Ion transporter n=1 Tax=Pseudochryseolinea flava TaxID=2059302 RepID=A0A364Y1R7_9BACT|nr:ion transporter [Pseudochryseolinea flava]RAW00654.1 ion transporter [Pseudochryseolinea flava]
MTNKKGWKTVLYETVFEADTRAGKLFDLTLLVLILLSTLTVMIETMPEIPKVFGHYFYKLEWFFTIVFTVEYVLRIIAARKKRRYIFSFLGIIDFLSILPAYIGIFISGAQVFLVIRIVRLIRVFRILKLAQFIGAGNTLRTALLASRHKISVFLLTVIMIVIVSGTTMYLIEGAEHGFTSIPRSIYWAIVTLTTVGYGDIAPETFLGQTIASLIMILGYGILAVPTGIVSAEMIQMKSHDKLSTQVCPACMRDGHDSDAVYCKYCSSKLN